MNDIILNIFIIVFLLIVGSKVLLFVVSCIGEIIEQSDKEEREYRELYGEVQDDK
jgi:hypothetical protein